jgi:hypothetical protein
VVGDYVDDLVITRSDCNNIKSFKEEMEVIGDYVDDLVITRSDCNNVKSFKEEMEVTLKMSDLDLLHYYLGIEVKQSVNSISLNQGAYAMNLLERCGMA